MPVHRGSDKYGPFFQYGNQKKYYYTYRDVKSRTAAKRKAIKQEQAIIASETLKN